MSYAIANVIYGVPLTSELVKAHAKHCRALYGEDENKWPVVLEDVSDGGIFEMFYTSLGEPSGFLGTHISSFYESAEPTPLLDLIPTEITSEVIEKTKNKIEQLPEYLKEVVSRPGLYIVWSSS